MISTACRCRWYFIILRICKMSSWIYKRSYQAAFLKCELLNTFYGSVSKFYKGNFLGSHSDDESRHSLCSSWLVSGIYCWTTDNRAQLAVSTIKAQSSFGEDIQFFSGVLCSSNCMEGLGLFRSFSLQVHEREKREGNNKCGDVI